MIAHEEVIKIMHRKFAEHMMPGEKITEHDIRLVALAKDLEKEYVKLDSNDDKHKTDSEWVKEYSQIHGAEMYICPKCLHTYSKPLSQCPSCGVKLNI